VKIRVITVSDRASAGEYEDLTGPAVEAVISAGLQNVEISRDLVPDDVAALTGALNAATEIDVILTAGGTGLGERDISPEVLQAWGEREVPGLAEFLRLRSLEQTNRAALSRGVAIQKGHTLAITLPGSVRGARFCAELLVPLLEHAVSMMSGGRH